MALRSSEYLQRNELERYQLDDVISLPRNNQYKLCLSIYINTIYINTTYFICIIGKNKLEAAII